MYLAIQIRILSGINVNTDIKVLSCCLDILWIDIDNRAEENSSCGISGSLEWKKELSCKGAQIILTVFYLLWFRVYWQGGRTYQRWWFWTKEKALFGRCQPLEDHKNGRRPGTNSGTRGFLIFLVGPTTYFSLFRFSVLWFLIFYWEALLPNLLPDIARLPLFRCFQILVSPSSNSVLFRLWISWK